MFRILTHLGNTVTKVNPLQTQQNAIILGMLTRIQATVSSASSAGIKDSKYTNSKADLIACFITNTSKDENQQSEIPNETFGMYLFRCVHMCRSTLHGDKSTSDAPHFPPPKMGSHVAWSLPTGLDWLKTKLKESTLRSLLTKCPFQHNHLHFVKKVWSRQ